MKVRRWTSKLVAALVFCTLIMVGVGAWDGWMAGGSVHRILGMTIGGLTVLVVIVLAATGMWKAAALAAFGLAIVSGQGWVGAVMARGGEAGNLPLLHAVLAQGFFAVVAAVATLEGSHAGIGLDGRTRATLKVAGALSLVLVLAQAALGAAYKHGLAGLVPHLTMAFVAAGVAVYVSLVARGARSQAGPLAKAGGRLLVAVVHQIPVGVLAYYLRIIPVGQSHWAWPGDLTTAAHAVISAALAGFSAQIVCLAWLARVPPVTGQQN